MKFFLKWCVLACLIEGKGFADVQARARTQEEKKTRQEDRRWAFTETELMEAKRFWLMPDTNHGFLVP
ncbi:hypothetical protein [Acetobacter estunensis]|nr:hypothetical protein [Acetobacter estunensis]